MIAGLPLVAAFFAALGSALMAGLFFAFSAAVMTALGQLPPEQGIAAMRSINVAILNPVFGAVFFGTAAACLGLTVTSLFRWGEAGMVFLLAGSLLYLGGVILVTMLCNVPLNDALAAVAPASSEGAALWTRYLANWTAWNHVRTAASLAALASFIVALQ